MRLLICAGGTGGGVYPALSVLKQLISMQPEALAGSQAPAGDSSTGELQVLWVGGSGMEADLVKREGLRFESIPAAGVHGVGLRALPGNVWQLSQGFLASRRILRKFYPDVLFYTGGFIAVPMALAARLSRHYKSLLYVPDIEPGLAVKTIARFSDCIALSVEESKTYFSYRSAFEVTGYPLRPGLGAWTTSEARSIFALQEDLPVLLVFGGSKGARSINRAVAEALPVLLNEMQVIHVTGNLDWQMLEQVRAGLPPDQLNRYRPFPYLYEEIGAAMRLADLALSRAGASVLGELPFFGLPAILVPYPYAWRYQRVNASYLVRRGAAVMVDDSQLADQIVPRVRELMADKDRREQMAKSMSSLAQFDAAARIASRLKNLAAQPMDAGMHKVPNPPD